MVNEFRVGEHAVVSLTAVHAVDSIRIARIERVGTRNIDRVRSAACRAGRTLRIGLALVVQQFEIRRDICFAREGVLTVSHRADAIHFREQVFNTCTARQKVVGEIDIDHSVTVGVDRSANQCRLREARNRRVRGRTGVIE